MFQKSRPALSNRFQSFSSSTSVLKCSKTEVTLRTPRLNRSSITGLADVRQHAHSGSNPKLDFGTTTCALLSKARPIKNISQSLDRKGMSQLKMRFHSQAVDCAAVFSSAVIIPPSGPSPGHRSAMHGAPNPPYLSVAPTILTSSAATVAPAATNSHIRINIGFPPISAIALSFPKRRLSPPASTYLASSAAVLLFVFPVTSHQSQVTIHSSSSGSRPGRRIPSSRNFSWRLCRCRPIVAAVRETFQR